MEKTKQIIKTDVDNYIEYLKSKKELTELIEINVELNKLKESIINTIRFKKNDQFVIVTEKTTLDNNIALEGIVFNIDSLNDLDKKIKENKLRMKEIIDNS